MLPLLLLDLANICSPYSIGLHYYPLSHTVMFYSSSERAMFLHNSYNPSLHSSTVSVTGWTSDFNWQYTLGGATLDEGDLGEEISSRFIQMSNFQTVLHKSACLRHGELAKNNKVTQNNTYLYIFDKI